MSRSHVVQCSVKSRTLIPDQDLGVLAIGGDVVCPPDYGSAVKQYPEVDFSQELRTDWFKSPMYLPRLECKYRAVATKCEDCDEPVTPYAVLLDLLAGDFISFGYIGLLELYRQNIAKFVPGKEYVVVASWDESPLLPGLWIPESGGRPILRGYGHDVVWDSTRTRFVQLEVYRAQ